MEQYKNCPICNNPMQLVSAAMHGCSFAHLDLFGDNCHIFNYSYSTTNLPATIRRWNLKILLQGKTVHIIRNFDCKPITVIRDEHDIIAELDYPLDEYLNDIDRLRNKLRTIITFS